MYEPQVCNGDSSGFALLINGNSGSSKTTISRTLVQTLREFGVAAEHVLFDRERHKFSSAGSYNYTNDSARHQTYIAAANHYRSRVENGENLIIDTGARDDTTRRPLIDGVPNIHFVHLECPLPIMVYRETKRSVTGKNIEMQRGRFLYLRAYASLLLPESRRFPQPGVTTPYEPPSIKPDIIIETDKRTIEGAVSELFAYMQKKGLIAAKV